MIITCENCTKKFNLQDDLIPEEGRELQCGSCNHKWFFKIKKNTIKLETEISTNLFHEKSTEKDDKIIENIHSINQNEKPIENKINKSITKKKYSKNNLKIIKNSIVFIISIVALIILLDTFKYQLSNYLPGLNSVLNNLYESLKDISLFFIDLIN
tara:strand:- start:779 stop:1246 length:468 start_codon:yes stop_codon:yes gene_type:complete